jgi:hypothetical protein
VLSPEVDDTNDNRIDTHESYAGPGPDMYDTKPVLRSWLYPSLNLEKQTIHNPTVTSARVISSLDYSLIYRNESKGEHGNILPISIFLFQEQGRKSVIFHLCKNES